MELSNLIRNLTLVEIKHVMFSFEGNKASDLDGFSFSFFSKLLITSRRGSTSAIGGLLA